MTRRISGLPLATLLATLAGPVSAQVAADKAETRAALRARTCFMDLGDGRMKCGGRPLRSLSEARRLLAPGTLVNDPKPGGCNSREAVWSFAWRALPAQPPIRIDARTGAVVECPI